MAQTKASPIVTVACTADSSVPLQTSAQLCADFLAALGMAHPNTTFAAQTKGVPDSGAFVSLETFHASTNSIEARLAWRAEGQAAQSGPRNTFSISDKAITPALQQQFLNRLVHDTMLPF